MKKALSIIILLCLYLAGFASVPVIDPELRSAMERYSDSDRIEIVVPMKAQYDRQRLCGQRVEGIYRGFTMLY